MVYTVHASKICVYKVCTSGYAVCRWSRRSRQAETVKTVLWASKASWKRNGHVAAQLEALKKRYGAQMEFRVFEFVRFWARLFHEKKSQYPMTTSDTTWFCNSYCGSGQVLKLSKASDSPSQKRVKERKNKKKRSNRFSESLCKQM